jgi:hypothetical protein
MLAPIQEPPAGFESRDGTDEETPTIKAIVRSGRVVALSLYVGAAGD